jgi:hypothetical protein
MKYVVRNYWEEKRDLEDITPASWYRSKVLKIHQATDTPGKRGAIKYSHVHNIAHNLSDIWKEFSGKPLAKTFEAAPRGQIKKNGRLVAPAGGFEEFISPGPRFVQVVIQQIDSCVPLTLIRTALRSRSVKGTSNI